MTLHIDEPPTETIPVVPEQVDDYEDDFLDDGFTAPQHRSRWTVALIGLLLVAIGFLGGVVVQRSFGTSDVPQRGTGATVSGTARPPAGAGALGRL